ncbi:MAG: hypothetical protein JXQ71_08605 [Verrucomicrobia bacterium]|nr:hypothetical protein [Verrucomicrobiota bacterium]
MDRLLLLLGLAGLAAILAAALARFAGAIGDPALKHLTLAATCLWFGAVLLRGWFRKPR